MKFTKTIVAAAALVLTMTTSVFAEEKTAYIEANMQNGIPISKVKDSGDKSAATGNTTVSSYTNSFGTVVKVLYLDDLVRIMTKLDSGETVGLNIYPQTPIFYYDTRVFSVNEGDRLVTGYKNSAVISKGEGIPKLIDVDAVLVINPTTTYSARIGKFAKKSESSLTNGDFTADFDEYTLIYDLNGNLISKETIYNKDLIVVYENIYGATPKYVKAIKIINLESQNNITAEKVKAANDFVNSIPAEQTTMKDGLKYVRISDLASNFGYELTWDKSANSATLVKGNDRYIISIKNVEYLHNDSLCYLTNEAFLSGGRMFIEAKFAVNFILNLPN